MTSLNWWTWTPVTASLVQKSGRRTSYTDRTIPNFVFKYPNFHYHGNKGPWETIVPGTVSEGLNGWSEALTAGLAVKTTKPLS